MTLERELESSKTPSSTDQVLRELSRVDVPPPLTLKNVIKETDTTTTIACLAFTLSFASGILAFTAPPTQITFMVKDLGQSELASWISTALTASIAATAPSVSGLTDVFGRRTALLLGFALSVLGSLISGFAPSTKLIIVGQAFTGCGLGFGTSATAALSEIVPAFTRPFWTTVQHSLAGILQAAGPIFAGALIKRAASGWRWIFYIDAILLGISFLVVLLTYKPTSRVRALGMSKGEALRNFDYIGFLLLTCGIILLLFGLSFGGDERYGWHSPAALATLVIGLSVLIAALPAYELWVAKFPLIKKSLFKDRNFVIIIVQTLVEGFVLTTSNVYIPQLFYAFWTRDPVLLGVYRLSMFGVTVIAQATAGLVFQRTGRYKWAYVFYAFLLLIGPALFAILRPNQPVGVPLGLGILTGLGMGGVTQLSYAVIQYCVPQRDLGIGLGILSSARTLGGALGVAIYNAILSSKEATTVSSAIIAAALKAGAQKTQLTAILTAIASGSVAQLQTAASGNMAIVQAVTTAYKDELSNAYRIVFLASIPFGVVGLISTLALREVTHYMTNETVFGVTHKEKDIVEEKEEDKNHETEHHEHAREETIRE